MLAASGNSFNFPILLQIPILSTIFYTDFLKSISDNDRCIAVDTQCE